MSEKLTIERYFTSEGEDVYSIPTRKVDVEIKDVQGKLFYKQKNVEVPLDWSDQAARIVSSKYFKDALGEQYGNKEYSVKQLVSRVVDSIAEQGVKQNYFDENQQKIFRDELAYLMLNQISAFNSPVEFNVGLANKYGFKESRTDEFFHYAYDFKNDCFTNNIDMYERPQVSACFISSLKDNMGGIMDVSKREAMLFKWGSGNGVNFGLRGYNEPLSKGGVASGVMYFMIGFDHWAKIIKSAGKTRRAAKICVIGVDHPDIYRFVLWKGNEELKAEALSVFKKYAPINKSDLDDEAHFTVSGQNSNNSVRMSDAFMIAYQDDNEWNLNFITARGRSDLEEIMYSMEDYHDDRYFPDKKFINGFSNKRKITRARTLMDVIAEVAKKTGDPGVQFDDTINEYNTCSNSGKINASNPCSEYMFLDDSACNLSSVNLLKFVDKNGKFDIKGFQHAVRLMTISQEILVDYASYPGPDESIARNSHEYRPLGLGYANLGALLMEQGLAYDSIQGRNVASSITSLLTGTAYNQSAEIARVKGSFKKFNENKKPFMSVMEKHRKSTNNIEHCALKGILEAAKYEWDNVIKQESFRNAQTTLLAPTGTIGFMMDCDTTGVEPLLGLRTLKNLSGGGRMTLANNSVKNGLRKLGYNDEQIEEIEEYIISKDNNGNLLHPYIDEKTPHVRGEDISVFATALGSKNMISYHGHINMMAAVQPFLSGGISKTVNLPMGSSKEDVKDAYVKAWKKGLKSIALYVDGSKGEVQPLQVGKKIEGNGLSWGDRKKLFNEIDSYTTTIRVRTAGGETPIHFHFGEDPETGMPLEFFAGFGGAGSDYSNVYNSFFKSMSRAVQYGEPLEKLVKDHIGAVGAINGFTEHPYIKSCTSIEDLWAKLIAGNYLLDTTTWQVKPNPETLRINVLKRRKRFERAERKIHPEFYEDNNECCDTEKKEEKIGAIIDISGRICSSCGSIMIRSGTNCFKCPNCFNDTGCG